MNAQRYELARWQSYRQAHQEVLAAEYLPLAARLREKRCAIAVLLDRATASQALTKRERAGIRDILVELLAALLGEAEDPALIVLYDKHADVSFAEEQQTDLDIIRTVATESLGIDVDAYQGEESPEELAAWVDAQVSAASKESRRPPRGKQDANAKVQEAIQEKAAEGATRAVREVFRKLVSELHPDREADPTEHARKTELMQRVNQAYQAGDLLALLEMQLSIEQINPAVLEGLAKERLKHYIHVLEEQSRGLEDQIATIIAPFARAVGDSKKVGRISPEVVQQALTEDIRGLKDTLRGVERDLRRFQDIQQLKQSLRGYEFHPPRRR